MSARITEAMVEAGARAAFDVWWGERGPGYETCWLSTKRQWLDQSRAALAAALSTEPGEAEGTTHRIEHDGFEGTVQGHYVTREGKRGLVLQQIGTKVVHVYGEKWLAAPLPEDTREDKP